MQGEFIYKIKLFKKIDTTRKINLTIINNKINRLKVSKVKGITIDNKAIEVKEY